MEDEKIASATFGIYNGLRDDSFKEFIKNILKDVSPKYKKILLSDSSLSYFSTAFTHPNANFNNNYIFLRSLGHVSFQKNTVWYLSKNKIVLQDKTKLDQSITDYKSRIIKSLGKFSENNIFDFISIEKKYKNYILGNTKNEEQNIQFVLEAFFGAVELILDRDFGIGVGNQVVYDLISKIFDQYVELDEVIEKDPKTKLNEIFINNKTILGTPFYEQVDYKDGIYYIELYQVLPNSKRILIGKGIDKPKRQAEKNAAKQALDNKMFYAYNSITGQIYEFRI
jgi:dsRNA-specific ribonuclease